MSHRVKIKEPIDLPERAQRACELLRDYGGDPISEALDAMSQARRAYNAIMIGGISSVDVTRDFMSQLATVTTILDDVLVDMWELMEDQEEEKEEETAT